jgi:hypothetical protein
MTTTTKRLTLDQLATATADRLTDELAAAGWDSTTRPVNELRADVARLLHEFWGPFDLTDERGEVIREATLGETIDSVLAGPEGWIEVDGQRCYVTE